MIMVSDITSQSKTADLKKLQALVDEAIIYFDTKVATEAQIQLEKLLKETGLDRKSFGKLSVMLAKVKFVRFASLTESELIDLIENYLPICFSMENFDLKTRIGKRIQFLGEIELQIEFMEKLVTAFERCKCWFGTEPILIEGKKYEPSLSNWIKAYLNQPAKSAVRTNIDEWSFIEQGLPAKILEKSERQILMKILKIYDSLRNRVYFYRALPESDDESEVFSNFDFYTYFPGLTINQQDPKWKEKLGNILDPTIEEPTEQSVVEEAKPDTYIVKQKFTLSDLPQVGTSTQVESAELQESKAAGEEGKPEAGESLTFNPLSFKKEKPLTAILPKPPPSSIARQSSLGGAIREGKRAGFGEGKTPPTPLASRVERNVEEAGEKGRGSTSPTFQSEQAEVDERQVQQAKGLSFIPSIPFGKEQAYPSPLTKQVAPPLPPKVNIDQKLKELKKKVERKRTFKN